MAGLKQSNKSHKTGKHRSKGATGVRGRVGLKASSGLKSKHLGKVDRRNKARQLRSAQRAALVNSRRAKGEPPLIIALVPVGGCVDHAHKILSSVSERITLVTPPTHNLFSFLDTVKIADYAVMVYDLLNPPNSAHPLLNALIAQGMPTAAHVAIDGFGLKGKPLNNAKKALSKHIHTHFPGDKLHMLNEQSAPSLLRSALAAQRRPLFTRDSHSYMLAERSEFTEDGVLLVSGYVRGNPLDVNAPVYVPGAGEFLLTQIDSWQSGEAMAVPSVLLTSDPGKQSLEREVVPDPMDSEQTWPTAEELATPPVTGTRRRVPVGVSDYQASWIVDDDSDSDCQDEWEVPGGSPPVLADIAGDSPSEGEVPSDDELMSVTGSDYDTHHDTGDDQRGLEALRSEREAQMFPDEMDTPLGTPARLRFQKYRGLASFKSSPWDKHENLPREYARIFQFERFTASRKKVLSQQPSGALPGWYVTLHIAGFPKDLYESMERSGEPLLLYSLLPHEHKMSLVHYVVRKSPHYQQPIKSKERLVFQCGVRRFSACPLLSQHTPGDKHKVERYMPSAGVCVASVYAPVSYPPQPLLLFKQSPDGSVELVGSGGLLTVSTDRLNIKRIVLSGHPYKINKRSATIRYMFFNRDDIEWFKPVELRSKHGRRGHIKEPLGTHGHMKCVFDGQLKAQDTALMNLYKRVFPKWTYEPLVTTPTGWSLSNDNMD